MGPHEMLSGCERAGRYASPNRGTAMWIGNEARVVGQEGLGGGVHNPAP